MSSAASAPVEEAAALRGGIIGWPLKSPPPWDMEKLSSPAKRLRLTVGTLQSQFIEGVKGGHYVVVRLLLGDERLDPNVADQDGYTALILAAEYGHDPVMALLLADERVDLNLTDESGCTALITAAQEDMASVATLLLRDERVDPNMATESGFTALIIAAYNESAAAVAVLLAEKRVDPNITDPAGRTALMYAAREGYASVVAMLVENERVDPNLAMPNGITALMYAAQEEHPSVVEVLLAHHRTIRARPDGDDNAAALYDAALFSVKYERHARFRGLVRAVVAFRRMRLRAAQAVYAPGGAGFMTAAASFEAEQQSASLQFGAI